MHCVLTGKEVQVYVSKCVSMCLADLSAMCSWRASRASLLSVFHMASVSGDISRVSRNAVALWTHARMHAHTHTYTHKQELELSNTGQNRQPQAAVAVSFVSTGQNQAAMHSPALHLSLHLSLSLSPALSRSLSLSLCYSHPLTQLPPPTTTSL